MTLSELQLKWPLLYEAAIVNRERALPPYDRTSNSLRIAFDWGKTSEGNSFWNLINDGEIEYVLRVYPSYDHRLEGWRQASQKIHTVCGVEYKIIGAYEKWVRAAPVDSSLFEDQAFIELELDAPTVAKEILGYYYEGVFPFCKSLEDVEKLFTHLNSVYEQREVEARC